MGKAFARRPARILALACLAVSTACGALHSGANGYLVLESSRFT
jgi:hypothetical protein